MKKLIICILLLAGMQTKLWACDVCGAGGSNQGLGLLPQMQRSFAGVQYQHYMVHSTHQPLSEFQATYALKTAYTTAQVWGRYYIGSRWQVFGMLPYKYNVTRGNGSNDTWQGPGDATLLANYMLVASADTVAIQHRLLVGAGIKAPTGRFDAAYKQPSGLPNIQPGTGTWDFPINANYTFKYRNTGVNVDASYTFNTAAANGYKYGNRLTAQCIGFYWLEAGNNAVVPQTGARIEYALHDYDNYSRKWLNEQTGGYVVSYMAGMQIYIGSFILQAQGYLPVAQFQGAGNIHAKYRADAGLIILF